MGMKRTAALLRRIADRIDYEGSPKTTHWSFTFEDREGIRFRQDGKGCPVAYLGDYAYDRAHYEADTCIGGFIRSDHPLAPEQATRFRSLWASIVGGFDSIRL